MRPMSRKIVHSEGDVPVHLDWVLCFRRHGSQDWIKEQFGFKWRRWFIPRMPNYWIPLLGHCITYNNGAVNCPFCDFIIFTPDLTIPALFLFRCKIQQDFIFSWIFVRNLLNWKKCHFKHRESYAESTEAWISGSDCFKTEPFQCSLFAKHKKKKKVSRVWAFFQFFFPLTLNFLRAIRSTIVVPCFSVFAALCSLLPSPSSLPLLCRSLFSRLSPRLFHALSHPLSTYT